MGGVSNVYNQAKQNAIAALNKSMSSRSSAKTASYKPVYLTSNGSIFNAPKAQTSNLVETNVKNSLSAISNKSLTTTNNGSTSTTGSSNTNGTVSEAEGKASASQLSGQSSKLTSTTSTVQANAKTVQSYDKSAVKLDKQIQKDNKAFQKAAKQEEKEIQNYNTKIAKLTNEMNEAQTEINNAQNELDSLLATSNSGSGSKNQSKITELQTFIGAKTSGVQQNGKIVYSLQRYQTRTLTRLNRTNAQYIQLNRTNTKALKSQQSETNKVIDFATKAEEMSALVQTGGQTLEMLGELMIAAGSTPWTAWMVPVGTIMAKVGTVAEVVGEYGQLAADVTKTAAYAADGNLMGAMQSAAAAMQAGAAAAKNTSSLKADFGSIDAKANEVLNNNAAKQAAKAEVKNMQDTAAQELAGEKGVEVGDLSKKDINQKAFDGMSKKDMQKSISQDLKNKMNAKNPTITREQLFNADGTLNTSITSASANTAKQNFAIEIAGGTTAKKAGKATVKSFKNVASSETKKSSTSYADRLTKMSQTLNSTAAIFGQMYSNSSSGISRGYAQQWDLTGDARYQRISKYNSTNMRHASYV